MKRLAAGFIGLATMLASAAIHAQEWPTRGVTIVAPLSAGGPSDAVARLIASELAHHVPRSVIVENRIGAGGNIGAEFVANAKPDGNTLLLALGSLVTNPLFFKGSRDPLDYEPVIQLTSGYFVLLTSNKSGLKSVAELVERIKSKPNTVKCGSAGGLTTLACELLRMQAGAGLAVVHYKGAADAMRDLQGGDIDVLLEFVNTAMAHVKSGRARAIAVSGTEKGRGEFPDLPTVSEVVPNFEMLGWHGILAPKGTPAETISAINTAFNKALQSKEVKEKLAAGGLEAVGGPPSVFATRLQKEAREYRRVAEFAKIEPQ